MKNYYKYALFCGISEKEFHSILICLQGFEKNFQKNELIQRAGEKIHYLGLITKGAVKISKDDYYGNSSLLDEIGQGHIFGEALLCMGVEISPVTVTALENTSILFLDFEKMLHTCQNSCPFHLLLIKNMLKLLAQKTVMQNLKIEILSKKGIREKVKAFLLYELEKNKTNTFEIPFNRKKLAEYLCVDRSALSNELCKMRKEGLLEFYKNKFEIKKEL